MEDEIICPLCMYNEAQLKKDDKRYYYECAQCGEVEVKECPYDQWKPNKDIK
jgi:predicted RNA-binding Zn-ribbon protein involved in translation (DUF1610 family)